jgi:hypothetical protein
MTEETKAGLKLLAEYMGYEESTYSVGGGFGIPAMKKGNDLKVLPLNPKDFPYNTSWDALVPVYAKARKEKPNFTINSVFTNSVKVDDKQAAFEAVVELVKLINKENASPH